MALDADRRPIGVANVWVSSKTFWRRLVVLHRRSLRRTVQLSTSFGTWLLESPLARFISGSLLRRILAANLVGVTIVILGILYFSQYHAWLIDSKRELLRVQGKIIAAAIAAGDNRPELGRFIVEDADSAKAASSPFNDSFAALELPIRPDRVAKILRRMIQPSVTRARIYARDGTLIFDSATLLTRGQLSRYEPRVGKDERLKTKNFWTRLKAWMIDKDLPVYKEIGNANGTAYPEVRRALQGKIAPMLLLNQRGEQIVSTAVPIERYKKVQGVLLISTRPGEIDQILAEERKLIWLLAAISLLAALVTSFLLARTVADPMRRLSAAADQASRNIAPRQEIPQYADRSDEVGQMASAFAAMTAALYRRIEASESFAADVAHELKNPLTAARSTSEALTFAKNDSQRAELVHQIQNELGRLNRLITDVSNASRLDAELARQEMKPVDVTSVATTVQKIFLDILSDDSRKVKTVISPAPFDDAFLVNGDNGRLCQVLTNLVDNAISFSPEEKSVVIRVQRKANSVIIAVDDEGPGIPEDRLAIIFDRFYTDRPQTEVQRGKNSGLGLSISHQIVRAHGGEIWAENRPGERPGQATQGARFAVRLPALLASSRTGVTSGRRPQDRS
jgi:two-component system, OmpR family, sensor histidine kinase ChvG